MHFGSFDLTGKTGSLFYMAPEVARNEPYNEKARAPIGCFWSLCHICVRRSQSRAAASPAAVFACQLSRRLSVITTLDVFAALLSQKTCSAMTAGDVHFDLLCRCRQTCSPSAASCTRSCAASSPRSWWSGRPATTSQPRSTLQRQRLCAAPRPELLLAKLTSLLHGSNADARPSASSVYNNA